MAPIGYLLKPSLEYVLAFCIAKIVFFFDVIRKMRKTDLEVKAKSMDTLV
jgi:hypothetical protein